MDEAKNALNREATDKETVVEPDPIPRRKKIGAALSLHREGKIPLVLSFVLPLVIFLAVLLIQGVYPVGDGQIINYDGWHQYYPFVMKLWDHFHEGQSLLYDWSMGMGTNFLSMLSYYGASPFNLILLFVPVRDFRVLFMLFTVFRIALAGLFMAMFLRKVTPGSGWALPFFSLSYALCSYMLGYFWNNMWLDTVALLPLVMLGLVKLFREGKTSLYSMSLAVALFANYYIGWMICLFAILSFVCLCVLDAPRFSALWRKAIRFGVASLLAGALAAILLLPAFFGLLNTVSTTAAAPVYHSFYESVRDIVASFSSFRSATVIGDTVTELGLPNLVTSTPVLLLAFAFLWAKKIRFREKALGFGVLLFLLFSMNYSLLNYIWHGMHFTNMIPYRFAFLFSFTVVLMACRYFVTALMEFDWIDAVGMILFVALIAFCALGRFASWTILATVATAMITIVSCIFLSGKILSRKIVSGIIAFLIFAEISVSSFFGIQAVGMTSYQNYFLGEKGDEIRELIAMVEEKEKDSSDFYRMELTQWYSLNDSCFYDYNGISQFASSANVNVSTFLQALGEPADSGSNRFTYVYGTPLSDVLLGVKYLIEREGFLSDPELTCLAASDHERTAALYENNNFLGLGFMVEEAAGEFSFDMSQSPTERQNALFRAITGLEGDLFTQIQPVESRHEAVSVTSPGNGDYTYVAEEREEQERAKLHFVYTLSEDSSVYIYASVPDATHVQVNNTWHDINDYANLFSAGYFLENESFHVRAFVGEPIVGDSDNASFHVCTLNRELWEEGMARLADEKMQILSFDDTRVEGKVTALREGYLYTSIPMEYAHAWEVMVDGEAVPIDPFTGAFVGIYLSQGEHEIVFEYSPLGFEKGTVISAAALIVWIILFVWERKRPLLAEKEIPVFENIGETQKDAVPEEDIIEKETSSEEENDHTEIDEHYPQGD